MVEMLWTVEHYFMVLRLGYCEKTIYRWNEMPSICKKMPQNRQTEMKTSGQTEDI